MSVIATFLLVVAAFLLLVSMPLGLYYRRMTVEKLREAKEPHGLTVSDNALPSYHLLGNVLLFGSPIVAIVLVTLITTGRIG